MENLFYVLGNLLLMVGIFTVPAVIAVSIVAAIVSDVFNIETGKLEDKIKNYTGLNVFELSFIVSVCCLATVVFGVVIVKLIPFITYILNTHLLIFLSVITFILIIFITNVISHVKSTKIEKANKIERAELLEQDKINNPVKYMRELSYVEIIDMLNTIIEDAVSEGRILNSFERAMIDELVTIQGKEHDEKVLEELAKLDSYTNDEFMLASALRCSRFCLALLLK